MKMIGKPYSRKLNVRFDEGELETGHYCHCASSLLYPELLLFILEESGHRKKEFDS